MSRILVTGGAGFIGSHLCDVLLSQGHDVLCLDNLFTGRKINIARHLDNPKFEFIRHDITIPMLLEVDEIYHLACPASPIHYQHNPVKTVKTSVMGTINMLGLAKRVGAKFLLASTSEVYGDPLEHPQKESYFGNVNTVGPRSCYDEGKRVAETLAYDYHKQSGVDSKIVRIFNTYGPRMLFNDGRVVSNFVRHALKNENIEIHGDGSQTRSFCYVTDLVAGIVATMNKDNFHGPVNLGNPHEITIKTLAEEVIARTNSQSKLGFQDFRVDDPMRRQPDITLAKTELRWEPKVSLEEGLPQIIADFRERMKK